MSESTKEGLSEREQRDDDLRIRHQALWPYVYTDDYPKVALNQLREMARTARDERDALREAAREVLDAWEHTTFGSYRTTGKTNMAQALAKLQALLRPALGASL